MIFEKKKVNNCLNVGNFYKCKGPSRINCFKSYIKWNFNLIVSLLITIQNATLKIRLLHCTYYQS